MTDAALSNLLHENRRFAPPADLAADANLKAEAYDRAEGRPAGVLGRAGRAAALGPAVGRGPRLVEPAVRQVVRRGQAQRGVQLPRPARRGRQRRQGRLPLRGRARRHPDHHLRRTAPRGVPGRQRPDRPGGEAGDRVAIYMPMIPETVDGDAGLRPDRRAAHGGVRRLLLRRARGPDPGLRRPRRHHRGRRLPPGRRRALKPAVDEALRSAPTSATCSSSGGPARTSSGHEGRDVWWHDVVERPSAEHEARGRSTPSTRST